MFSKEREDLVVPDEGVAGIDDPVVLLREADELRLDAEALEVVEETESLNLGNTEVHATVEYESRSLHVVSIACRREVPVYCALVSRHAEELCGDKV